MRKPGMKMFLKSCVFWLIPGIAAGFLSAVFYSSHEFSFTVKLAEYVLEGESLPASLKQAIGNTPAVSGPESNDPAAGGRNYLEQYGYRRFGSMTRHLPYTLAVSIFLFEAAGAVVCLIQARQTKYSMSRIESLTEYLKAAGRGEAGALTRQEDVFSHLEDEIYKTVFELSCTKEEAVKDHEVLSARIADIAHQLKTPLTSMSLMAELLESQDSQEENEYLDRLKQQVERLKGLVNGLLTLAKLDSHTLELHPEDIDTEELLRESAAPLKGLMGQNEIALDICKNDKEILLHADALWTPEAFLNILKNCMEHTPKGGRIRVDITQNPLYTEITIEDGGSGFQKKDLPHLFERFYKGEGASKDSAGIGLALAKAIIERQGGQIHAENSPQAHARFCIRFY